MPNRHASDSSIRRLSMYLRHLEQLERQGIERVSSRRLAQDLHVGDALVRKDLASFGQFGRPGIGYDVGRLMKSLRTILGTNRTWRVVLVGAGALGTALVRYAEFRQKGFHIVAAFDIARNKVGKTIAEVPIHDIDDLPKVVRESGVKLGIIAVPAEAAQKTADLLVDAGIRGVLNLAPAALEAPGDLPVNRVDLTAHLEQLSFQVSQLPTRRKTRKPRPSQPEA
ncbi:MAG: redox-sensing transcriptional repressor Rex [Phycisphaerae bacterium]